MDLVFKNTEDLLWWFNFLYMCAQLLAVLSEAFGKHEYDDSSEKQPLIRNQICIEERPCDPALIAGNILESTFYNVLN